MINSFMFLQQQYPSIYGSTAGTPNSLTTKGGTVDSTSHTTLLYIGTVRIARSSGQCVDREAELGEYVRPWHDFHRRNF